MDGSLLGKALERCAGRHGQGAAPPSGALAGRRAIRLLAVSKFHSVEDIQTLASGRSALFRRKLRAGGSAPRWKGCPRTSVGILSATCEPNKVRHVAGRFALIHGLDSVKLARALQNKLEELGERQDVLVQVNLAQEAQKSGISEADLPDLAQFWRAPVGCAGAGSCSCRRFLMIPEGRWLLFRGVGGSGTGWAALWS